MNEMVKTLQGQQRTIVDLTANIKRLSTGPTDRGQNGQPQSQPQF